MHKLLKYSPHKKQDKTKQVTHLFKNRTEKVMRQLAAYLNRKTSLWDRKMKTYFLFSLCLFFILSMIFVFIRKPNIPAAKGLSGPVIIKLIIPPGDPGPIPPAAIPHNNAGKNKKKPP